MNNIAVGLNPNKSLGRMNTIFLLHQVHFLQFAEVLSLSVGICPTVLPQRIPLYVWHHGGPSA